MSKVSQIHFFNLLVDELCFIVWTHSLNLSVEVQMLSDSQIFKDCIELGTIADHATG